MSSLLDGALDLASAPNPVHVWRKGARLLAVMLVLAVVAELLRRSARDDDYGVSPASTRDSTEESTLPPLTTATTRPDPATPDAATATGSAPAPSTTT
jgi:hypothetical protein